MAERSAKQLGLSKADLPNSVIEVIATLKKNGFDAYIVGGGVRDTLLGLSPKDFDAVTDAKPHEIKDIFGKRCRIIGRRFQLAHVYSGRDMIEVATFRAPPNGDAHTTSDGMIVRDNVWGDIHQDFARRDFSVNAMYYDPIKGVVHDFCDALDDIKNQKIRLLGHAPLRVEEDPVRLLRALRFKAKLGFDFDEALSQQFTNDNWSLLDQVSPHRLYDESQKMFTGGYLVPLLPLLFEYGAIRHLIIYPPKKPTALVQQVAVNTDKRIAIGKSINPAFFYAALLWDNYLYQLAKFKKKNIPFHDAQLQASSKVIDRQRIKTAIPKFAEQFIRDIWVMQPKLANPKVKQIPQLAEHARFRAAFDFLLLREQCDDASNPLSESTNGMGEWWQTYQTLSEKQKRQAMDDFANDSQRNANKPSRNHKARNNKQVGTHVDSEQFDSDQSNIDQSNDTRRQDDNKQKGDNNINKKSNDKRQNNRINREKSETHTHTHYAKERNQLQKLSLGELAGDNLASDKQPSPLFVIDAEKIAKQVPKQLSLMNASDQAVHKVDAPKVDEGTKANTASKAKRKNNNEQRAKSVTRDTSKQSTDNQEVLVRSEPVPSKRRRRQPTQQLTQAEILQQGKQSAIKSDSKNNAGKEIAKETVDNKAVANNTSIKKNSANVDETRSDKRSAQRTVKPKTSNPQADTVKVSTKNQSATNQDAINQGSTNGDVKNERVPAKRRRRQPTSDKSVSERLNQ